MNKLMNRLWIASAIFLSLSIWTPSADACPTGIAGISDANSTVCAESTSTGTLYCRQADANGDFFIYGGVVPPSTGGCLPLSGEYWFYNVDCYDDGMSVNRSISSERYGGTWLDVTCKPEPLHQPKICLLATDWESFDGYVTTLWDVAAGTGAVFNPRSTGIGHVIGIAIHPSNAFLYAVTSVGGIPANPNSLYRVNMGTGASTLIGPLGIGSLFEGDLAFGDDGTLYGVQDDLLYTIDTLTGAATVVGNPNGQDYSFLSFNGSNTMFAIDNGSPAGLVNDLDELDPTNADVLATQVLSEELGGYGGMDWNQLGGWMWVADGKTPGSSIAGHRKLFRLNPSTGVLSEVGDLGLSHGVTGLASCKPCAVEYALDTQASPPGDMSHGEVLKMAYRVRDELLDTSRVGKYYIDRFYNHSLRVVYLMTQDDSLWNETTQYLHLLAPGLLDLLDGEGRILIDADMIVATRSLAQRYSELDQVSGQGALANAISEEMQRMDLDQLTGRSFADAWTYLNTLPTDTSSSVGPVVFVDGFESGDASAWTEATEVLKSVMRWFFVPEK